MIELARLADGADVLLSGPLPVLRVVAPESLQATAAAGGVSGPTMSLARAGLKL
jgi:hypothetical protein